MIYVGDIMSTSGDVQYIRVLNINERLLSITSPMISSQYIYDIPLMYS